MDRFRRNKEADNGVVDTPPSDYRNDPLATVPKSFGQRIMPVMASGAGLFSDGYIQNVIGSVSTMLGKIYGDRYTDSTAKQNVSSIAFAGTVVGQLVFGYTSDKWSRRNTLLLSTTLLIIFSALCAGSYGWHGSTGGLFAAITAWRFFLGIGIGGEYPAGSVGASEATGELKAGTRNRWFVLATNVMIDWGFVIGAFVPYICVVIFGDDHLRVAWRVALGLGCIPPLILFYFRLKMGEPEEFKRESMRHVKIPYIFVIKFYFTRLFVVSLIWFLYDFSTYSFSIYSSTIIETIIPNASLAQNFGWNTVINLFYIPGAMFGSLLSDWIGPRYALAIGVTAQALVGYLMAGLYATLATPAHIGGFCVIYGIFLSLGEVGPGDNIGLVASKTCATGVRGQYYGIAAAIGKIGAFVGTYVFPYIIKAGNNVTTQNQYPFWVSSSLCILSACLALFCLPHIGQDTITTEDIRFREYLEGHGWDTSQLGLQNQNGARMAEEQTVVGGGEKVEEN